MVDDYCYSLNGYILNNYEFIRKIGAGTYGLIYLVEEIDTGKRFAAKMLLKAPPMKLENTDDNKRQIQRIFYNHFHGKHNLDCESIDLDQLKYQGTQCPFLREIALQLRVHDHANVVLIHEVVNISQLAVIIIMDYFPQGDLFHNIIDKQIFTLHQGNKQLMMKNVMLQLIDAVEFCASKLIFHCDLKPENIMVKYNPNYRRKSMDPIIDYNEIQVVLIDFGLAMNSNVICCNACRGSLFYMAPERLTNFNTLTIIKNMIDLSQYQQIDSEDELNLRYFPTVAGDIWSLGVLFINIACLRNPWPMALFELGTVFRDYIIKNKRSILLQILPISHQFNLVLDRIFQLNPNDRISLHSLRLAINDVDLFYDYPLTPPTEPLLDLPEVKGQLISPENSQMEQCRNQLKKFNCPHHC